MITTHLRKLKFKEDIEDFKIKISRAKKAVLHQKLLNKKQYLY